LGCCDLIVAENAALLYGPVLAARPCSRRRRPRRS
jgi:hypothetical protein